MDLIDFIHASNQTTDADELTAKFLTFLREFGIDRFIMGQLSHDTTAKKEQYLGMMVNYPNEWMEYYVKNHYVNHDPVYQNAITAKKPFTWAEIERRELSATAVKVMNESRDNKLYGGIALSIHRPLGSIIGMGFASSLQDSRDDKDAVSMINAAAHQYFTVYADLTKFDDPGQTPVELTPRETEVLFWLAKGKSKGDIGEILVISDSSVKRYSESIFQKLRVNNSQAAVAKGLRMGLIKPF